MTDNVNGNAGGEEAPPPQEATPIEWDKWLADQPDEVKQAYEANTSGLKSALKSEREAVKEREKEIRNLAEKADKGSELEKQLTQMADNLATESQRADAYEQLHAAGVSNLRAVFTLAKADNLFDRKGNVDVDALKTSYPEFFNTRRVPSGGAGEGTGQPIPASQDMNSIIRRTAGRQ